MTAASGFISSKTSFSATRANAFASRVNRHLATVSKAESHLARLKRLRRTVLNTARMLESRPDAGRYYWVMVTLTYAPAFKWDPKHVSGFLSSVRQYLRVSFNITKLHYTWVMELQKRGAPHYHVLLRLPVGVRIPKPDKAGWWFLGHTNTEAARHAIGYLAKYASKGDALGRHEFPKGARLHGASQLEGDEGSFRRWWNLPVWVRESIGFVCHVTRVAGGVMVTRTGLFLACPFEVLRENGQIIILSKEIPA